MKHLRIAVYAAAAIVLMFALVTISGCGGGGGALNNTITSPYNGYLDGVATEPADGETNIRTDRDGSWIHVFWPDLHTSSPPRFTVSLEKEETPGNWGGVHTRLGVSQSAPDECSWWLQPDSNFSPFTAYRIIVSAPGETSYIAYFETGPNMTLSSGLSTRSGSAPKGNRPAKPGDADGEDSVVHTITK